MTKTICPKCGEDALRIKMETIVGSATESNCGTKIYHSAIRLSYLFIHPKQQGMPILREDRRVIVKNIKRRCMIYGDYCILPRGN